MPALGAPVFELLAPKPGERVLDLGCGDGALTEKLVAAGAVVVGIDASTEQIAGARAKGLDARVGDGAGLAFANEFDAVFSNAALHWMKDADAVIAGVWRALRPGGRFVGEFGGEGNVNTIVEALVEGLQARGIDPGPVWPWFFPSAADYRARLERRGFAVSSIALVPRPTPLPSGLEGWLETFGESFVKAVPDGQRPAYINDMVTRLRPKLLGSDGRWVADYVRLRFAAFKPDAPNGGG